MSVAEIVVMVVAAVVAASALCWFAVAVAVRRVRSDRARRNGSAQHGSV